MPAKVSSRGHDEGTARRATRSFVRSGGLATSWARMTGAGGVAVLLTLKDTGDEDGWRVGQE